MRPIFKLLFFITLASCKEGRSDNSTTVKTTAQWKQQLTAAQYAVLRQSATEKPFTGKLLENEKKGIYFCAGCANKVFDSEHKYHSGKGWPAFDRAVPEHIKLVLDHSENTLR